MKTPLLIAAALGFAAPRLLSQAFGNINVTGTANVNALDVSGVIGIGADPSTEDVISFPEAPLFIAKPEIASIRLLTTRVNNSYTNSAETIDLADGPGNELIGEIAGLNADFPSGGGLYQPKQLTIWSGQAGGLLFLARNWPGAAGPIIFADGDYFTGEVMRITTTHQVGVGGESAPASLVSMKGNASVGSDYSETPAPPDGLIIQGNVGIGTATPQAQLEVKGDAQFDGALFIEPQGDVTMGIFTVKQVHVADDAARFALTPDQVKLNDVVVVGTAPPLYYQVINRGRLQTPAGYKALQAP